MDRKLPRGKRKLKGKHPIICFSCNKVGQIFADCPDIEDKDQRKESKYKGRRYDKDNRRNKDYKDKGMKSCYITKEETDNESNSNDEEVVCVSMKKDYDEDGKIVLISFVSKGDRQIIDSGFSHDMTSDKSKFETLEQYKGSCVKFGNNAPCLVKGKGLIKLTNKIKCDNVYWVKGLNYNLLSAVQLRKLGYKVEFHHKKATIFDATGELIGSGK